MGSKNKKQRKGESDDAKGSGGVEEGKQMITDPRFSSAHTDPRFRRVPRRESKVAIDSRFKGMFTDKRFATASAPVDKRGKRRRGGSGKDSLKEFYRIDEEEEEKNKEKEKDNEGQSGDELESEQELMDLKSESEAESEEESKSEKKLGLKLATSDEESESEEEDAEEVSEEEEEEDTDEDDEAFYEDDGPEIEVNCLTLILDFLILQILMVVMVCRKRT